jgi:hypothetical protein
MGNEHGRTSVPVCGEATSMRYDVPEISRNDQNELHKITHSNDTSGRYANNPSNQYQGSTDHTAEANAKIAEIKGKYDYVPTYPQ